MTLSTSPRHVITGRAVLLNRNQGIVAEFTFAANVSVRIYGILNVHAGNVGTCNALVAAGALASSEKRVFNNAFSLNFRVDNGVIPTELVFRTINTVGVDSVGWFEIPAVVALLGHDNTRLTAV